MFLRWLTRWMANRHRAIFSYWDGTRRRRVDPLVVTRRLTEHPDFDWDVHPALVLEGMDDAIRITADAVRYAFEVDPYLNGRGLTELECVDLLGRYVGWLTDVKKNTSQTLMSQESTVSESWDGESATNATSGSGSTETAPNSAAASL